MKRPSRSDTYGGLVSICQSTDEHGRASSHVYGGEFQSLLEGLDDEGCVEESVHIAEKKRRLSVDQVKALEKNFEIENKLEPERKVKLAQELGLQPRQVAVWFQNRRARYKTKQLEKDYGILKANFDALKLRFEALQHQNDALREEVRELESKVEEDNPAESQIVIKEEEMIVSESENNQAVEETNEEERGSPKFSNAVAADLKDGSSDSDSSVIFNEGHSPVAASLPFQYQHRHQVFAFGGSEQKSAYQAQYAKVEDQNIFGGEEPSYFFPEDQAPTLQWWN